ncbi:hypothetical protein ACNPON_17545 [Glutamicibacter sp. AGC13]
MSDRFIETIIEVATKAPGSRILVVTPRRATVMQEIDAAVSATSLKTTYRAPYSEYALSNGSVIQLGQITSTRDTHRYAGAEFQLIAFDDMERYSIKDVAYMESRLRAEGRLREDMDAQGLQLSSTFRGKGGAGNG